MSEDSMGRKRKVRILWLNEWHLEEHEAWFGDMARQGWKLEKLGIWFVTFVESVPEEISYRIEIANKNDEIESDRIHLYDDAGWEYITSRRYMYVFRERQAKTAVEIHTDSSLQAETLEILRKSIWRDVVGITLITILMVTLATMQIRDMSSYDMLGNGFLSSIILLIFYLPLSIHWLLGMIQISSLIKKLKNGGRLQRNKNYKGKLNRIRFGVLVVVLLYLSLFFLSLSLNGAFSQQERYPEIPEGGELPIISLTDVEDVHLAQVTYDTTGIERKIENHIIEKSSILIPKQFILHQQFIIPEKTWNNSEEKYQPSILSKKYEALTVGIAEKLVDLLLEEQHVAEPFIDKRMTGFDEYRLIDGGSYIIIIARVGKSVYDINYFGKESIKALNNRLMNHENVN